jgi:hypothetical protein
MPFYPGKRRRTQRFIADSRSLFPARMTMSRKAAIDFALAIEDVLEQFESSIRMA